MKCNRIKNLSKNIMQSKFVICIKYSIFSIFLSEIHFKTFEYLKQNILHFIYFPSQTFCLRGPLEI